MHVFKNWMTGPWCVNSCPPAGRSRLTSWVHCGGPAAFPMPPSCCEPCWSTWPPAVPSRRRSLAPDRPVGVTSRRWPCSRGFELPSNGCAGWPTSFGSAIPPRRCPTAAAPVPSMPRPSAGPAAWAPTGGSTSASTWRICSATSSRSPMSAGGRPSGESPWPPAMCCWGIVAMARHRVSPTSPGPAATSWCGSTTGPCRCGISRDDRSGWPRNCGDDRGTDPGVADRRPPRRE